MFRAAIIALVLAISFEVSGLSALCGELAEDEDCSSDCSGGECAPNCHSCACCSFPQTLVSAFAVELPLTQAGAAIRHAEIGAPASADPADIFHVPKPVLA